MTTESRSNAAVAPDIDTDAGATRLAWRVQRFRGSAMLLGPVVVATLCTAFIGARMFHTPLAGLLAVALIGGSTLEFWLPVACEVGPSGVVSRCLLYNYQIDWARVRRCAINSEGVLVSPLSAPSRLDAFRGVYLRFGTTQGCNREAVLSALSLYFTPRAHEEP